MGESLIKLPWFIKPIVESASFNEVTVFPYELYVTLKDDYKLFEEFYDQAKTKFEPGIVTTDNLFCVQLKLHEKQWGLKAPGDKDLGLLMDHFRLHGRQHVVDFNLLNSGGVYFISEDLDLKDPISKDSILEARVMLRQLLDKSLPYYVLSQILTFQREWMMGSRSEYAWAGHVLFSKLAKEANKDEVIKGKLQNVSDITKAIKEEAVWTLGMDQLSAEDFHRLAFACASHNFNFADMVNP
ncbi:MAG: hypothetical protein WCH62_05270 [Candidatus Omnitrophota bacterium]